MDRRVILAINDLVSEESEAKKERKVEIYKNEVYKDIDLYTHKHVEGSGSQDLRSRNAVSSDNSEDVDGSVIARYVEFWDAKLRKRIKFALADMTQEYSDDDLTLDDHMYRYRFLLPESFNDNTLRPLAEYIHRFLVWGGLFDWYSQFGSPQAAVYGSKLEELEDDIASLLRAPAVVKRPMQPFGPARKFR